MVSEVFIVALHCQSKVRRSVDVWMRRAPIVTRRLSSGKEPQSAKSVGNVRESPTARSPSEAELRHQASIDSMKEEVRSLNQA